MLRFIKATVALTAMGAALALAACGTQPGATPSPTPGLGAGATLEQVLDAARQVEAGLRSYRYKLEATAGSRRSGEERSETDLQATGKWAAPGNFRTEISVPGGPDGRVGTYQHLFVDGRYFMLTERDEGVWRETGFPQPGEPPRSIIGETAEWELVDADATLDGLSVYHLRAMGTQERAYEDAWEDGRTNSITEFAHDLYLSHGDMLPRRLETSGVARAVRADGETVDENRGVWYYDFFDHNTPIAIDLPEPRVDLPPTPHPDATPTPIPTPTPDLSRGAEGRRIDPLFLGVAPGPDWERIEVRPQPSSRGFSLLLPLGWKYRELQGIDSFVGEFAGDGITLRFNYGWYSNQLAMQGREQDPAYLVRYEEVAGLEAKFVRPVPGGEGYTGIYIPGIAPSIGSLPVSLNIITVGTVEEDDHELVFGILRPVQPL